MVVLYLSICSSFYIIVWFDSIDIPLHAEVCKKYTANIANSHTAAVLFVVVVDLILLIGTKPAGIHMHQELLYHGTTFTFRKVCSIQEEVYRKSAITAVSSYCCHFILTSMCQGDVDIPILFSFTWGSLQEMRFKFSHSSSSSCCCFILFLFGQLEKIEPVCAKEWIHASDPPILYQQHEYARCTFHAVCKISCF